jgi:multiple sugar transport system permease protein
LGLVVNSLIAYALARIPFPGRKLLVVGIVALILIPFESVAVPLLLLVNQFPWFDGSTTWIDSYQVQILPFIADAFSIFLFYQFFMDIPKAIEEAARIDGASRLRMPV